MTPGWAGPIPGMAVSRNVTARCNVTGMPATLRTCTVCETEFHGRADAAYCSTACRQKAYRARTRLIHNETPSRAVTAGPVPDGDEWMDCRFFSDNCPGYLPSAATRANIEANVKTPKVRDRRIAEAAADGRHVIEDYIKTVATIGRELYGDEDRTGVIGTDLDTPLGDTLPPSIDPATAADLAEQLHRVLPRVHELVDLLERRGHEER